MRKARLYMGAALLALSGAYAQAVNTYWGKIGKWDMSSVDTWPVSLAGIPPTSIVAVTVIIHSDPVNGKVDVDRLDRAGFGEIQGSTLWARGGIWQVSSAAGNLQLYRGPIPQTNPDPQRNRFTQGQHVDQTVNRGWYRIDYLGAPVNAPQPYAIKTKVLTLGTWNMSAVEQHPVDLTQYGKPANRVASFQVTIASDDGAASSDLIRIGPSGNNGGVGYITDKLSPIQAILINRTGLDESYFTGGTRYWNYDGSGNRGFIKIDYSAAECGEGSGYTRAFIGFTPNGDDCHGNNGSGTAAVHVVQTKGQDIWNYFDKFAFIHKARTDSIRNYTVRVDRIENTNSWARAGVMVRASTQAGSRHASLFVTPGNGICFGSRSGDNVSSNVYVTSHSCTDTGKKAPYWLQIRKVKDSFTGWISTNGSTWTQVGGARTVPFPVGSTYLVGLAQSAGNNTSSLLNTSIYSNVSF